MSINLLPWRQKLERKKLFRLALITGILVSLCISISLPFYLQQKKLQKSQIILLTSLKNQIQKISIYHSENTLETYHTLNSKIIKITSFRNLRMSLSAKLFNIIEKTPSGISLTKLSMSENETKIEGFSAHKTALESYMKKISVLYRNEEFSIKINETTDKILFQILILGGKKL